MGRDDESWARLNYLSAALGELAAVQADVNKQVEIRIERVRRVLEEVVASLEHSFNHPHIRMTDVRELMKGVKGNEGRGDVDAESSVAGGSGKQDGERAKSGDGTGSG